MLAGVGVGWWSLALGPPVFVVLTTGVILPHEPVHGLAIRYYGGTPRYGVGLVHFVLPYASATTATRKTPFASAASTSARW